MRQRKLTEMLNLVKKIHLKVFETPLEMDLSHLTVGENRIKLVNILGSLDIDHPTFIEFLKDQS